ncbi:hypothetical protein V9T40_002845 [Parthenolecanium corni]|uniref:Uncharacterized protein n=1 Tax=Parthenolecanium corni TaxID=536013 RepID=A0AAN9TGW1_9HEMI
MANLTPWFRHWLRHIARIRLDVSNSNTIPINVSFSKKERRCLNFRPIVSFFVQMSQFLEKLRSPTSRRKFVEMSNFSSRCLNFYPDSMFSILNSWLDFQLDYRLLGGFQLSQFSSRCLNFRLHVSFSSRCLNCCPAVSIFVQLSHFSSSCLNLNLVYMSQFSSSWHNIRPVVSIVCPDVSIFVQETTG